MFDKTREKLLELHEKHGRGMFNILKARANREIFDRIYELTNEACRGRDISFSTRCYLIFHGMKDFPECQNENCHNRVIENINSFQTGFHRFCSVKCGSEAESTKKKIGEYFCHDNIIDGIVIGFSDLRNDFLKGIIDYEKSQGNNVTSLIFDRRLYSTDQIVSLSDKIEYVEQTRYAVYGSSSRHMSGKNRNRIFTHIWDCGYIRMII